LQAWAKTVGPADFKRIAPQVIAVQLDQVEGVEEYGAVMAPMPDAVERCDAILVAGDGLAIYGAGRERRRLSASTISGKR
jgi:hypothetical protein